MTKYARALDGRVLETFVPPEGLTLEECFHADVAAQFTACDDDVEEGWAHQEGVFAAPVPLEPIPERPDLLHAVPAIMDRVAELERRIKILEDQTARCGTADRNSDALDSPH